jgi:hypothetical protein
MLVSLLQGNEKFEKKKNFKAAIRTIGFKNQKLYNFTACLFVAFV